MSKPNRKTSTVQITIGLFFIGFIAVIVDSSMSLVLAPVIKDLVGNSSLKYSLIGTMVFLGNIIMIYPLTKLSDRIGRKNTFLISISIMVLGTLSFYFVTQYWMILVLRFIVGLNSLAGVISALVIDQFPEEERGKPLSMYSVGIVFGYLIGTLIGGLISSLEPKHSYLIIGSFTLLAILNIFINIKDAPRGEIYKVQEENSVSMKNSLIFLKSNKALVGTLIQNFLALLILGGSGTYGIYMFFTYFGETGIKGALFLLPVQVVEIVTFMILGRVKNFKKLFKMNFGLLIILLGFIIAYLFGVDDPYTFSVCISFFGIILASLVQSADSISHKLIPSEHKSNLASIYRFAGILGNIVGPVLIGAITQVWVYLPGLFIICILLIVEILYWKWISKEQSIIIE